MYMETFITVKVFMCLNAVLCSCEQSKLKLDCWTRVHAFLLCDVYASMFLVVWFCLAQSTNMACHIVVTTYSYRPKMRIWWTSTVTPAFKSVCTEDLYNVKTLTSVAAGSGEQVSGVMQNFRYTLIGTIADDVVIDVHKQTNISLPLHEDKKASIGSW